LRHFFYLLFIAIYGLPGLVLAQSTVVSGKVTDAETGEPMPYVNVYFKGSTTGTTTDFDGFYKLSTNNPADSLVAHYVGYGLRAKAVAKGKTQVIHFQLKPDTKTLETVTVTPKGYVNPAWEILEAVMEYKRNYDPRRLSAYQYESYTKLELDVDNVSEKFQKRRMVKQILAVIDSAKAVAGEDGRPVLPIFISETLSDYFYRDNPQRSRELVRKTKVTGVGVEDGSVVSQLTGSTFQQYNFYQNWLKLANKEFISPIADGWKGFYDYELKEKAVQYKGYQCFRIDFAPKRPEDLAFKGSMWITDSTGTQPAFALLQIDVEVGKAANLNFIDKIKVQQEMQQADSLGAWLPAKTRILLDIGDIRDDWAGILAKFYVSNKNFVVNQPKEGKFYDLGITVADDVVEQDPAYWNAHRHDSLTQTERNVYQMIDTIRNLPVVRSYVEVANILINGYKRVGKIDFGTYSFLYANNNIEGHRFRLGATTNYLLSKKLIVHGMAAYGTLDQRWKYEAGFDYILARRPWTQFGFSRLDDYNQLALFSDNFLEINNTLFSAFTKWNNLQSRRPFVQKLNKLYFKTDLAKGITQKITFNQQQIEPLYSFEYIPEGNERERRRNFTTAELAFETRIAFGEQFIQNENSRVSLGVKDNTPIIMLRYTMGLKGVMGSDFRYDKLLANVTHRFSLGAIGYSRYSLTGAIIPSRVPYPLLAVHLGNQTFFYNDQAFNLMNFFEFVSDRYVSFNYIHRFEGLMFNRLPLVRKWKWRTFATANALIGSLDPANRALTPATDLQGQPLLGVNGLGREPYVELGYGVENIFRFVRVDFIHRLTYLDTPNIQRFGIKVSAQFRL
jgi:hypothetical protein